MIGFNTQPPEGGWASRDVANRIALVSTHSRPKAAGIAALSSSPSCSWFQHTAARRRLALVILGIRIPQGFQHTAARRRLAAIAKASAGTCLFQHTAARRRLEQDSGGLLRLESFNTQPPEGGWCILRQMQHFIGVSTHSRPKAAGQNGHTAPPITRCFNTQPPEGGWCIP